MRSMNRCMASPFAAAGSSPAPSSQRTDSRGQRSCSLTTLLKRLRRAEGESRRRLERCEDVPVMTDLGNGGSDRTRHGRQRGHRRDRGAGQSARPVADRTHHGAACIRHCNRGHQHRCDHHEHDNDASLFHKTVLSVETLRVAPRIRSRIVVRGYPPDRVRAASARRKKLPSVTTLSPGLSPSRTGTNSPVGCPSFTARSMNLPSSPSAGT